MATTSPFTLPENLSISNIGAIHDEMEAFLDKCDSEEIVMVAGSVSRADTAGLQMLVAMVEASKQKHIKIRWESPSETLKSTSELLGLSKSLEFG